MGARNLGDWPNRWSRSGPNRAIGSGGGRTCVGERERKKEVRENETREERERRKRKKKEKEERERRKR